MNWLSLGSIGPKQVGSRGSELGLGVVTLHADVEHELLSDACLECGPEVADLFKEARLGVKCYLQVLKSTEREKDVNSFVSRSILSYVISHIMWCLVLHHIPSESCQCDAAPHKKTFPLHN